MASASDVAPGHNKDDTDSPATGIGVGKENTMSNDELLAQLNNAIARAEASVVAANAAATTANAAAAANQASAGSLGGVAGARTQSNVEQASMNDAILKSVSQNIDSDIGVTEAWSANVKRTYDIHQTFDTEVMVRNRTHFDTMITQLQTHIANLNQMTIQSLANNQNQSNLNNTLSIDRSWNINETDLAAKSAAIITDKVLAAMAAKDSST